MRFLGINNIKNVIAYEAFYSRKYAELQREFETQGTDARHHSASGVHLSYKH